MQPTLIYPLEQVLEVKRRRVDAAEKEVARCREELEKEKERLKEVEKARDKVKQHLLDKVNQLRDAFDQGTNTDEIQMMKRYIAVVQDNLAVEEEKVKKQEEQVEIAKNNLELAIADLEKKRREVEKLEEHREQWFKMMKKEQEIELGKEMDELGSILFLANKRKYE